MEDLNLLAADCVVISCCCQCLVLQLLVFLLLKLPYKLFRKARDFAKRRVRAAGGNVGKSLARIVENRVMVRLDSLSSREGSRRSRSRSRRGKACMEEVEKALEELTRQGEFGFGSFWGQYESVRGSPQTPANSDCNIICRFQIIQMIGSPN
uniref:Uncharacterized protein n=1 Tax=Kalanchoe fedtschenkoi TaxID=63787 RepID=A0A7N0UL19_KALFE